MRAGIPYRADIDGLRAIAIVTVLIYHFWPEALPGGFLGVDLFMVISGYLITALLMAWLDADEFSFRVFYYRRARRLLPSLFIVVLLSLAAGALVLSPESWFRLLDSSRWTLLFAANIGFWQQHGYFEPAAAAAPLLHTWSLGVEEQFYLFWPVLLWMGWKLGKLRRSFLIVFLVLGGLSSFFAAGLDLEQRLSRSQFYLPHHRAWEFVCGALLVFVPRIRNETVLTASVIAGLSLAAWASFSHDSRVSRIDLLYRCVAAMLMLYGGVSYFGQRVLGNRVMLWIGARSYALYLLHWPLLTFLYLCSMKQPSALATIALLPVVVVLADFLYRYVENPWRSGRYRLLVGNGPGMMAWICMLLLLVTVALSPLAREPIFRWMAGNEVYRELLRVSQGVVREERRVVQRIAQCHFAEGVESFDAFMERFEDCNVVEAESFAVIGDSHAGDFFAALQHAYPDRNFLQFTMNGPLRRPTSGRISMMEFAVNFAAINADQIAGVFYTGRAYPPELPWNRWAWKKLQSLQSLGVPVMVIAPHAEFDPPVPDLLYRHGTYQGFDEFGNQYLKGHVKEIDSQMQARITRNYGMHYLRLQELWCPEGICPLHDPDSGRLLVMDYGHWTTPGAELVGEVLRRNYPNPEMLFSQPRQ